MYNLRTMENNLIFIYKEDSNPEDYLKFFNDYYLPIVGGKAFLVYTTLKNMVNKSIEENKLTELLSISKVDFNYAKSVLEGIGLISTFKKDNNFIILLNPVLPPSTFFNKKHLCAALLSSLNNDKDEYQKIVDKYRNKFDLTGYENVSSSFLDIYNIEVANNEKNNYRISLKSNNSDFSFSFSIFLKELKKNSQINAKMIKDKDQEKIEYLANLYEINEEEMARYVTIFFDLLNKDIPAFAQDYQEFLAGNSAPPCRLYAEALLVFLAGKTASLDEVKRWNIPPSLMADFHEYTRLYEAGGGKAAPLRSKFEKTYWFYFHFAQPMNK